MHIWLRNSSSQKGDHHSSHPCPSTLWTHQELIVSVTLLPNRWGNQWPSFRCTCIQRSIKYQIFFLLLDLWWCSPASSRKNPTFSSLSLLSDHRSEISDRSRETCAPTADLFYDRTLWLCCMKYTVLSIPLSADIFYLALATVDYSPKRYSDPALDDRRPWASFCLGAKLRLPEAETYKLYCYILYLHTLYLCYYDVARTFLQSVLCMSELQCEGKHNRIVPTARNTMHEATVG